MATTHGQASRTKSRTYLIWQSMVGRCHRPTDSSYKYYGAKGVTVCDRWRKFEDFFADMGIAPDGMHLHRTNGSTVYSKETCQWLSESEHIGLHNMEQGWGARMNRTQLIDALAGAKQQLAAERKRADKSERDYDCGNLREQLAAEQKDHTEHMKSVQDFYSRKLVEENTRALAAEKQLAAEREKVHTLVELLGEAREVLSVADDFVSRIDAALAKVVK